MTTVDDLPRLENAASEETYPHKLRRLYWPFLALAEACPEIIGTFVDSFDCSGRRYTIPRFAFLGPETSAPSTRLGIFAVVHGDEPAGALALERLLGELAAQPQLAAGYEVVCYPLCNPTGYEDGTRTNRAGADLNREFWRSSSTQPEIRILEAELRAQAFDGIIALHSDDTCHGLYGYTQGRVMNENLLLPALRASAHVLPIDPRGIIDGFAAQEGRISQCYPGILAPPPEQRPQPFEIIFETPATAPMTHQVEATCCALHAVLAEYRGFIAQGANL